MLKLGEECSDDTPCGGGRERVGRVETVGARSVVLLRNNNDGDNNNSEGSEVSGRRRKKTSGGADEASFEFIQSPAHRVRPRRVPVSRPRACRSRLAQSHFRPADSPAAVLASHHSRRQSVIGSAEIETRSSISSIMLDWNKVRVTGYK
jgi:hypothetical protein